MINRTYDSGYHNYLIYNYGTRSNKIYGAHDNLYFEYRKYLTKIYEK